MSSYLIAATLILLACILARWIGRLIVDVKSIIDNKDQQGTGE